MSTLPTVGKYQLIRKLATGGMAEVYLAKTAGAHGFEKTVVLKRILPHLAEDENFVHMFFSEAKLAAQLNHPNVVTVFDFGQEDGAYFLVMEYIDGPNLRALFKRANELKSPIPFGVVAKIISFACEGLAFAHEFIDPETNEPMNLVHRDISPDNILMARNGGVKVVDFGIAKASNQTHHTRTGTIKGKFAYMPPEQLRGQPLDLRADIFALGIVLHELIAGVKPFEIASDAVIMQAILYEKMKPAATFRPDTPPQLQAIIDRALEKEREARYPDCRAMQADLEKFIYSTGEPVGQHQLAQLVQRLASSPSGSHPAAVPKTPSHPSLAVATPGFVRDGGASQANAMAVSPSQVIEPTDFRIELSKGASPAPTGIVPPPASSPRPPSNASLPAAPAYSAPHPPTAVTSSEKPQAPQAYYDPGQMQIRSSAVLPVAEDAPSKRGKAWAYVLALGLVFLGAGGALVAVKFLNAPKADAEPVLVAKVAKTETPPEPPKPVEAPKPPEPVKVAEAPPPEPPKPVVAEPAPPPPEPVKAAPSKKPPPKAKGRVAEKAPPPKPVEVAKAPEPVRAPPPEPVKAAPPPEPPPPQPLKVVIAEKGVVSFRIRPFAEVLINGDFKGETPLGAIELPAGRVTIRLINKELGKDITVPFEVKPGQNVFKYNLAE